LVQQEKEEVGSRLPRNLLKRHSLVGRKADMIRDASNTLTCGVSQNWS